MMWSRARSSNAVLVAGLVLLMVPVVTVQAEGQHGGAIPNSGNDMVVVQGEADNPLGLSAGYGSVVVRESLSFANTDPSLTTNYGIAFISPIFEWDDLYPRVTFYKWDYEVANYTVKLFNLTSGMQHNITGVTNDTLVLHPDDLNPDEPGQPDPKTNTTYDWNALVIDSQGVEIMSFYGGYFTTKHNETTVVDLGPLELPPIGPNTFKASDLQLFEMSMNLVFEPHLNLTQGFYRVYIGDTIFHYGVTFTVVVQYHGELVNDRVVIDKLIFLARPIDIDIYDEKGMEVKVFDSMDGKGSQLSPAHVSEGAGDPTSYHTESTYSVVVQEEGTEGPDWGVIYRYTALFGVIALLVIAVLWSGPRRRDKAGDEEGDDDEDEEGEGDLEEEEVPAKPPKRKRASKKERDVEDRREELEKRKASLLGEIHSVDARHEDGALTNREWKATRAALKARAVDVMKELEALEALEEGADDG